MLSNPLAESGWTLTGVAGTLFAVRGRMLSQFDVAVQKHCEAAGWPRGSKEAADRRGLVGVDVKHGVQLGDLQQVANLLGEVEQLQLSAARFH